MAYTPYATAEEYQELFPNGPAVTAETLRTASRHVDSLTFNRIVGAGGVEQLTPFQRELIKEVVCRQAAFEAENADVIASVLQSYAINGVSMQFGESWNVMVQDGVAMQRDVYAMLQQTGLCCRLAR